MVTRGDDAPKIIKRKLSDSVSVSGGEGTGSGEGRKPGQSTGSGFKARVLSPSQLAAQKRDRENKEAAAAAKERRDERIAEQERQREKVREANRQKEEEERLRKKDKVSTGVFSEGGAIVQKTTGAFATLQGLEGQRPGSKIFKEADGSFVLVELRGANINKTSTFEQFQSNLAIEGRDKLFPSGATSERQEGGDTLFKRDIKDEVGGSEGIGGIIESPGGTAFHINLTEGGNKKQTGKEVTRPFQAGDDRLIAAEITAGSRSPIFIGGLTNVSAPSIRGQQKLAKEQQKFKDGDQKFPQTFVGARGQDIVTVTGKSEGAKFGIFQKIKAEKPQVKELGLKATILRKEESPSKGIERTLKNLAEPIVAAGITSTAGGLLDLKLRIEGKPIEEREKIIKETFPIREILGTPKGRTPSQAILEDPELAAIRISKGESVTGQGRASDIISGGIEVAAITGGIVGKADKIKKIKDVPKIIQKIFKPKETVKEKLPVNSKLRGVLDEDTALFGITEQRIKLGVGVTKQPTVRVQPKVTPVKSDPSFKPSRVPISRDPSILPEGELATFQAIRAPLGRGTIKTIKPEISKSSISLGEGKGVRPRQDFTTQKVALGRSAVKTPPRRLTAREQKVRGDVQLDPDFRVPRFPVNRLGILEPRFASEKAKLGSGAGKIIQSGKFSEKQVRLGIGLGSNVFPGSRPSLSRTSKPPTRTAPKDEARVSKGLILLTKQKPLTQTKISLGKSTQTLQIREGKTIQDSIGKTKTKTSRAPFSSAAIQGVVSVETEQVAFPTQSKQAPFLKQSIKPILSTQLKTSPLTRTTSRPGIKQTTVIRPKLTQQEKTRTRLVSPLRTPTGTKQILTPIQKQPPIQKQIIEEVPPEEPILTPRAILIRRPEATPRKKRKEAPRKERVDFLGSTSVESVIGITKGDFSFGKKSGKKLKKRISLENKIKSTARTVSIF